MRKLFRMNLVQYHSFHEIYCQLILFFLNNTTILTPLTPKFYGFINLFLHILSIIWSDVHCCRKILRIIFSTIRIAQCFKNRKIVKLRMWLWLPMQYLKIIKSTFFLTKKIFSPNCTLFKVYVCTYILERDYESPFACKVAFWICCAFLLK